MPKQKLTKYIILCHARTGSSLLWLHLHSHPHIHSMGEMLRDKAIKKKMSRWAFLHFQINPVSYLKHHVFVPENEHTKSVGFKLPYVHGQDFKKPFPLIGQKTSAIWNYLNQLSDLKVIHLKRRNLLRAYVSRRLAEQTGKWRRGKLNQNPKLRTIALDFDHCKKAFEEWMGYRIKYDLFFKDHDIKEIFYEDMSTNLKPTLESVFKFLGVPSYETTCPIKKLNPFRLSEMIENYEELKDGFKNTEWIRFFDDEQTSINRHTSQASSKSG